MHEYDLIADWYATDRGTWSGVAEVTSLAESLPRGARIIDIGCGHGKPLDYADLLAAHGLHLIETHLDRGQNVYYLARKD